MTSINKFCPALLLVLTLPTLPACQLGGGNSASNLTSNTSGTLDRRITDGLTDNGPVDSDIGPSGDETPAVSSDILVTSTPADVYLAPGEKAIFTVAATSGLELNYQWYKNGAVIEGATTPTLEQAVSSADDAGIYKVVITNLEQSESASAQLTVSDQVTSDVSGNPISPATIITAPQSLAVNEGKSATFTVSAKGSNLRYEWMKGGQVLPVNSSTLRFASVHALDQDTYSCRVWNENNSVNCGTFTLTVNQKVAITEQPMDASGYEYESVTLSVKATGTPTPVVDWYFQGRRIKQNASSLTLNSLKQSQAGAYKCVVRNTVNKLDCAAANVVVKKKVRITRNPTNQILNAGENFNLDIAATGSGPLQYKCYRDGKLAVSATDPKDLVISDSQASDSGNYYCEVSNDGSSATTGSAKISVLEDTTRNITLRWAAPTKRENGENLKQAELAEYVIYLADQVDGPFEAAKTVKASQTSAELTDLLPGDYYLAISTVDTEGMESEKSSVARIDIE